MTVETEEVEEKVIIKQKVGGLRPKGSSSRTPEEMRQLFSEYGYTLEMNQEIRSFKKMLAYDKEGYRIMTRANRLIEGITPQIIGIHNPHTIWNIRNIWLPNNAPDFELVSESFSGVKNKLIWRLKDSHLPDFEMTWGNFKMLKRHPVIGTIEGENRRKIKWEEMKEIIDNRINGDWKRRNLTLIVEDDYEIVDMETDIVFFKDDKGYLYCSHLRSVRYGYSPQRYNHIFPDVCSYNLTVWNDNYNKNERMVETTYKGDGKYEFICEQHGSFTKHLGDAFAGVMCAKCEVDSRRGENHPLWDSSLSEEERDDKRRKPEYREWVKAIYERDNYSCTVCYVTENIVAHHLDGFNWCVARRTDIDNGVVLCDTCHKEFHGEYGYGNNTVEQFEEWRDNYVQ